MDCFLQEIPTALHMLPDYVGSLTVGFFFCVSDHKLNISKAEIFLDPKVNPNF